MLRRKSLPAGALFMIMVLALASLAVGYGLWSKILVIEGEVHTGEVDARLSLHEVDQSDSFDDFCPQGGYTIGQDCDGDGELNDDLEAEGKDVAECIAELLEEDMVLKVTVRNAYPSFNCFVRWDVKNTGSIPIHVYGPAYFIKDDFFGNAINTSFLHANVWPPEPPCYALWDEFVQLEPGDEVECNLHVHPNQGAEMNATYTFNVRIFARQWNELVGPPWPQEE